MSQSVSPNPDEWFQRTERGLEKADRPLEIITQGKVNEFMILSIRISGDSDMKVIDAG